MFLKQNRESIQSTESSSKFKIAVSFIVFKKFNRYFSINLSVFSGSWAEGVSNNLFKHQGWIKVSPLSVDQTIEQVVDDAINVGAEDVTGIMLIEY